MIHVEHQGINAFNHLQPGVVDTGIWRNTPFPLSLLMALVKTFFKNIQEGIQTVLYCALSPDLEGSTGRYYRDCKAGHPLVQVYKIEWQDYLFEKSREICQMTDDDPKI
jgi:hypothetical protein